MGPDGSLRAVIFDLDGLVVDSEPVQVEAWRRAVEGFGGRFELDLLHPYWGRPVAETAAGLGRQFGVDPSELEAARDRAFDGLLQLGIPIMPTLPEAAGIVRTSRLQTGLVTSGTRPYADVVLGTLARDHGIVFDAVVTRDDVERAKPDPEPYLMAAGMLDLDPAACAVIEDAPSGIASAKAAGMTAVAVPSEYTSTLDLSRADSVQPDLASAVRWLLARTREAMPG
jgi:beta-phosphoglucomutase-like phosphatase (HAD superfamily)